MCSLQCKMWLGEHRSSMQVVSCEFSLFDTPYQILNLNLKIKNQKKKREKKRKRRKRKIKKKKKGKHHRTAKAQRRGNTLSIWTPGLVLW